ncbi:hypothetical protein FHX52_2381 [Humibacillus xanthopallidus]|uniref:Uncharacterized protein n=1 Tax=Humibacillus xanthopallidus TaxID=412689 RepID=A0A543PNL3_9MICO|nr:hypothetical protein [Humibacillus xanthopallidus]TQN45681.1 hypothetical protein FHX52_2381 [Humibacillus xanthopallidus]
MNNPNGRRTPLVVTLRDSADARLFVELSSYGSDLTEARHALDLAVQGKEEGSPLAEAAPYLVGFAVVAYCRTILHSNVRGRLTDHVTVPAELSVVHDQVRAFRNATIAHSQSELAVTYPTALLDADTLEVQYVGAATMISSLPSPLVGRFRTLVAVMEELLDVAIQPVRARLEAALRAMDPRERATGALPTVQEKLANEFEPRTKRPPYPTSHTIYWEPGASTDDSDGAQPRTAP